MFDDLIEEPKKENCLTCQYSKVYTVGKHLNVECQVDLCDYRPSSDIKNYE
jgi:hypothetical protein